MDPHHVAADPDSTYHPDADPDPDFDFLFDANPDPTFYPDADPDPDPDLRFEKGSSHWKSAKIGSYSILFGLTSPT